MSRLTDMKLPLLVKLGSIAVHAGKVIDNGIRIGAGDTGSDEAALRALLDDPDVVAWIKSMDAAGFMPRKGV